MAAPSRCTAMTLALLATSVWPAEAEVVHFNKMSIPAPRTLSTYYLFFAGSSGDGGSVVWSQGLQLSPESGHTPEVSSVQVALLPRDRLKELVGKNFCENAPNDDRQKVLLINKPSGVSSVAQLGVSVETVPWEPNSLTSTHTVPSPSVYVLAIANCGTEAGKISGSFSLRNSHGFLPANEYATMQYYGWLSLFYLVILLAWLGSVERRCDSLLYIHKGLTTIVLLGFFEALCTWVQYKDWNSTGDRRWFLVGGMLQLNTLKVLFAWRLILVVCKHGEEKLPIGFHVVSGLFMIQQCASKVVLFFRFSHSLGKGVLLLFILPGTSVYMIMFAWAFSSLSSHLDELEEGKQDLVLENLERSRVPLALCLVLSCFVVLLQVVDAVKPNGLFPWALQWVPGDGAPNIAFHAGLLLMLVIWWPSGGLGPSGAADEEMQTLSASVSDPVRVNLDLPLEEEEEQAGLQAGLQAGFQTGFQGQSLKSVSPQVIGTTVQDEEERELL